MWITRTSINQPVFATMVMLGARRLRRVLVSAVAGRADAGTTRRTCGFPCRIRAPRPRRSKATSSSRSRTSSTLVDGVKNISRRARRCRLFEIEFRLDTDIARPRRKCATRSRRFARRLPRADSRSDTVSRATNDTTQGRRRAGRLFREAQYSRSVDDRRSADRQATAELPRRRQRIVSGALERRSRSSCVPSSCSSYRVGVDQVIAAIQAANQDLPAGSISTGTREQLVRVEGRIKDPRGFERIIVANQAAGRSTCPRSPTSSTAKPKSSSIARVNGQRSVSIDVFKVQQTNIVEVGAGVQEAVEELKRASAGRRQDRTLWSNADWIKGSLDRVKATILEGAAAHDPDRVLVPALVALDDHHGPHAADLRRSRRSLRCMRRLHAQLHDVDGAVVVHRLAHRRRDRRAREHRASRRHGQEPSARGARGHAPKSASRSWRRRSRSLAVFIPVAFMGGVIGRFFFQFGITVAVAVLVSLIVELPRSIRCCPRSGRTRRKVASSTCRGSGR